MTIISVSQALKILTIDSYTLKDGDNIIYDGDIVYEELSRYSTFLTNIEFSNHWITYVKSYWPQYLSMYKTSMIEYNPIYNYDNTEKSVDTRNDGATTQTETPDSSIVQTTPSESTVKNFYTTDENATYRQDSQSVTTIGKSETATTTTTTTGTNTITTTHDETNVSFEIDDRNIHTGDTVATHILTRKGNIGVTTTQQMIESEYILREKSILEMFIKRFADMYFFIGGEPLDINFIYNIFPE